MAGLPATEANAAKTGKALASVPAASPFGPGRRGEACISRGPTAKNRRFAVSALPRRLRTARLLPHPPPCRARGSGDKVWGRARNRAEIHNEKERDTTLEHIANDGQWRIRRGG